MAISRQFRVEPPGHQWNDPQREWLKRLVDWVSQVRQSIQANGAGGQIVNNSALTFQAGTVIGFSGGLMALADDTSDTLGPVFVTLEDAAPGAYFTPQSWGLVDVRVATTSGWSIGAPAYVDAGTATPTAPGSGSYRYQLGVSMAATPTNGKIQLFLVPTLWSPQYIP